MKNLNKAIQLFFVLQLLIFGCTNESKKHNLVISGDTLTKQQKLKIPNVIEQDSIRPYKQVDSIYSVLKKRFNFYEVRKLDSLCLLSDGDLTELLDGLTVDIFNNNLKDFSEYLIQNPKSCLKIRLIEGLGNNYSVYKKDERKVKILEEKDRLIALAKKQNLNDVEIGFIKNLLQKINPNQLD